MLSPARSIVLVLALVALLLAALRWLRVAQREHYLAGSALRFARRWWALDVLDAGAAVAAVIGVVASFRVPLAGLATVLVLALGPRGLAPRGRSSPLVATRRLRTLAAATALLAVAGALAAWFAGGGAALLTSVLALALLTPLLVDLATVLVAPFERRAARRYVLAATRRLNEVAPIVLAVTGSYGKTTTKGYLAHLLSGRFSVLASPRSFNNAAGLARTVNELLLPGTEVLVAEMGTYGPGELRALCSWLSPRVSVITAIGPVHLERFGTLDAIAHAKAEITEGAEISVLNVDDPLLGALAERLVAAGQTVLACSARDVGADVALVEAEGGRTLFVAGAAIGAVQLSSEASIAWSNVACAVGGATALGCSPGELLARLSQLPVAENRLQRRAATSGATILDDTFNSNPAGTRLALAALAALPVERRVLVTPGMVELGRVQFEENARFAEAAADIVDELIVVGRTNRKSLLAGVRAHGRGTPGRPAVHVVATRDAAVERVRATLGAADAVLYENDLPDHYP